nr:hypothetical protein [Tanacetum cinerariifolium]
MEICTKLSDSVLSLEQIKTNQAAKIKKLKQRVKKLEGKKEKNSWTKEGRIAKIDADEDLSLINETTHNQGRMNDGDLFGVNDLDGDEVIVDVPAGENVEQDATVAKKEVSAAADEVVTTGESVKEVTKGSSKRAGDEIEKESAKRQREDLEVLRSIVKERFKKTNPVNDMDNILF